MMIEAFLNIYVIGMWFTAAGVALLGAVSDSKPWKLGVGLAGYLIFCFIWSIAHQ